MEEFMVHMSVTLRNLSGIITLSFIKPDYLYVLNNTPARNSFNSVLSTVYVC